MTTSALLAMIARAKNRNEAARAYRDGLRSGRTYNAGNSINWPAVNAAIAQRWNKRSLEQIRCWAWKMERGA